MLDAPKWTDVGSFWVSVAGLCSVLFAIYTLRITNKQNGIANVVACEGLMQTARARFSDSTVRKSKLLTDKASEEDLKLAEFVENEALEAYLNTIDRLCAAILRANIPEKDYRGDYAQFIANAMVTYSAKLGPETVHRNIVIAYNRWKAFLEPTSEKA